MFDRRAREMILGMLSLGEMGGRELREEMGNHGVRKGLVGFYSLMARMEDSGEVEGKWVTLVLTGCRERRYQLPEGE